MWWVLQTVSVLHRVFTRREQKMRHAVHFSTSRWSWLTRKVRFELLIPILLSFYISESLHPNVFMLSFHGGIFYWGYEERTFELNQMITTTFMATNALTLCKKANDIHLLQHHRYSNFCVETLQWCNLATCKHRNKWFFITGSHNEWLSAFARRWRSSY